jgi:hypothetical protein
MTGIGAGFPAGSCPTGFDAFSGVLSVFSNPDNLIRRFSLIHAFILMYMLCHATCAKEIRSTPKSWDFHSFAGLVGFCY